MLVPVALIDKRKKKIERVFGSHSSSWTFVKNAGKAQRGRPETFVLYIDSLFSPFRSIKVSFGLFSRASAPLPEHYTVDVTNPLSRKFYIAPRNFGLIIARGIQRSFRMATAFFLLPRLFSCRNSCRTQLCQNHPLIPPWCTGIPHRSRVRFKRKLSPSDRCRARSHWFA